MGIERTSIFVGFEIATLIQEETMDNFDESLIAAPTAISPARIKQLREDNHVSQRVFAQHLNMRKSTIGEWESGSRRPGPIALKLLSIVEKHGLKILA